MREIESSVCIASNSIENVLFIYLLFWIGLFEGDILIDQETKNYLLGGKIMSRDAVISPIFYWPRGILYYTFDPKLGEFSYDYSSKFT